MLDKFYQTLGGPTSVSVVIISIAIILLCGFAVTRLTKLLRLPNVTAYIFTGIIIGPYCLNLIPSEIISGMGFLSDIALAFIAFGTGQYLRLSKLKRNGKSVTVITLFESLLATVLVFVLTFVILRLGLAFSLILSALAAATAPASTMMTIRQTKAHGDFVDTLLSVVALDDIVSLLAFSVAISAALATTGNGFTAKDILLPVAFNVLLIVLGAGLGLLLKALMAKRSTDNRLIVSVAFLFALCGVGSALGVSPLLGCMAMGMTYMNTSNDERLFQQLNYFNPPVLLLFFVLSGLSFRLDALFDTGYSLGGIPLIVVGVLYFFVRIAGKYLGALIGCAITKKPKSVRNYLGLALIPQAGVSIGLAALAARMLGGEIGAAIQTVILVSGILYELIGPACAKLSLYLSKSYGDRSQPESEKPVQPTPQDETDALKKRLCEIEEEIARKEYARTEEEAAFNEAIDEQSEEQGKPYNRKFINRR